MHLYFVNTGGLAKVGFILYNKQNESEDLKYIM